MVRYRTGVEARHSVREMGSVLEYNKGVCGRTGTRDGSSNGAYGWLFVTDKPAREMHTSSSLERWWTLLLELLGGGGEPGELQSMKIFTRELPQLVSGSKALRRRAMSRKRRESGEGETEEDCTRKSFSLYH